MATKLGTILADFTTSLATDIAIGGTTATLSSATDDDSVALPSGRYFFTLDGTNSSKEHISCDLVGTALTNIKSLSRQGVETTGCARKHRIGTTVSLTDFGHIKFINDLVAGTTTLNASAPLGYDGAPASLTGNQLATVTYVLGVVNGGTVTFDQQTISAQTSGEALTINDIVYFKESDARWYKVDADLTATFDTLQLGIVKTTAGASGVTIQVAISGPVSGFTGLTAGSKYYVSNTAGAITTTPGTYSVFVGYALSTTILLFDPVPKTLPTQKEKDAMVGSQGVPSSTNTYVTADNVSVATTDQTQTTQNSTIETGEADATTRKNKIAQSFVPVRTKIKGAKLYKSANTGTNIGDVTLALQADTAGSPSGSDLATKTYTASEWNALAVGEVTFTFSSEYTSLVSGTTYWLVLRSSTSDTSNHANFGTNTAGGYSSGSVKYNNTTDGWVAVANIDLYFKTLEGVTGQIVKTNSTGGIPTDFLPTSSLPTPCFQQEIASNEAFPSSGLQSAFGSNQDGSVIYTYSSSHTILRFERDASGSYWYTHRNTGATALTASDQGSIIQIGDYIYVFNNGGTNVTVKRYLAADLTGEQAMTVPTVACTEHVTAWTDGTFAYLVSSTADTVSHKWSLSGTTFSAVSTATVTTAIFGDPYMSSFWDGSNAYVVKATNSSAPDNILIYKLTSIDGSVLSTTTKTLYQFNDTWSIFPILGASIDTTRMYVGVGVISYNATSAMAWKFMLIPITKP